MATLDELIKARLEEKRREQEEIRRQQEEEKTRWSRQESIVSKLFSDRLEAQYGLDMQSFPYLVAATCNGGGVFEVQIELSEEAYPYIFYTYPLILTHMEDKLETERTDNEPWKAWHNQGKCHEFANLIDALVYATYGTVDPDRVEAQQKPNYVPF